jgi:hypothetical protein
MTSNTLDTPKVSAGFDINAQFRAVMHELGLSPEDTGGSITFIGEDPIFPTKHRLGACIGIPIMAGAAGVADIWRQRSGRGQDLTLDYSRVIPHRFAVATVFLLLRDVFSGVVWWGGGRERLRGREPPHLCVVVENFVVCG